MAKSQRLAVPDTVNAKALPGRGVQGVVGGEILMLGSTRLMLESGTAPLDYWNVRLPLKSKGELSPGYFVAAEMKQRHWAF